MNLLTRIKLKLRYYSDMATMMAARIVACFVDGKDVWFIAEKPNEARDNGYWFCRYMRHHHPEAKIYYAIDSCAVDYSKVAKLGKVITIKPRTFRHRVLFWTAEYNVGSQPMSDYFTSFIKLRFFRKRQQINIFLRHGVAKDLLDHSIDNTKSGIDVFITSAYREQQSIIANNGYNILTCPLTGFCRYDNLSIHPEHRSRKILVMPTFRHWLMPSGRDNTAVSDDFEKFKDSEFCRTYNNLLSSAKVARLLNKFNYQLIFYPHYCTQPFLSCFIDNQRTDRVILASKEHYDVQKLLIESDILITDFSSVFFDFAYMKKPEIFYQFDEAQFRGGHYKEGYFKYREDAFGPVLTEEDEVIDYLQYLLENDSTIEDKYLSRIDGFFAYNDQNNCERTYQAIMNFKSEMR